VTQFYSENGFTITINHLSSVSGTYILTGPSGTIEDSGSLSGTSTVLYITTADSDGSYALNINDDDWGIITSIVLQDYVIGTTLATIEELIGPVDTIYLINGLNETTRFPITISYPLGTLTFATPEGTTISWRCVEQDPGQSGWASLIAALDPDVVVADISQCSTYAGEFDEASLCTGTTSVFLFEVYDNETDEVLYGRLDCCCPSVTPIALELIYICTCPDWSRYTSYNQTLFSASTRLRQWVDSGAGARGDCKHIYATKRIDNVDFEEATDPPYDYQPPPPTPN
jgi:hypothetical protein